MARTKPQAAPRRYNEPESRPAPGWVWLLAGIVLGLFAALMINTAIKRGSVTGLAAVSSDEIDTLQAHSKSPSIPPLPPLDDSKLFEFDEKLKKPEKFVAPRDPPRQVMLQAPKINPTLPNLSLPQKEVHIGGAESQSPRVLSSGYLLMVGSFRSPQRADDLLSRVSSMGLQASVTRGKSAANDLMHRVQIGPVGLPEANRLQQELKRKRIDSIILRADG